MHGLPHVFLLSVIHVLSETTVCIRRRVFHIAMVRAYSGINGGFFDTPQWFYEKAFFPCHG